jgi:hypothetical protein
MNPEGTLTCTACGMHWDVSEEDVDATLADALEHAARRHPAENPHHIIQGEAK